MFKIDFCYIIIIFILPSIESTESTPKNENHIISKRHLLFPQFTIMQFSYGLSVPLILPSRSITLSLVLQQNYVLPFNLSNFEALFSRSGGNIDVDFTRNSLYEYFINILNALGINGEECFLRLICETAETPFQVENNEELLEKIAHFILTPSIDLNSWTNLSNKTEITDEKYLLAERLGQINGKCFKIYTKCDVSLLDQFTSVFI